MGFSKNDFEKVDLRIKKITEQTVEQIEIDSELPPTIEQLEDNNRTYSIMAAILFIDIRKSTYLTENSQAKSMVKIYTEVTDTWLDAVRNLRNYCAHNSMLVGMTSSVVLLDSNDDTTLLQADNDLFSRIYALKKLVPTADVDNMKNDIKKLIKETPVDVYLLGILPSNWEEIYDKIVEF